MAKVNHDASPSLRTAYIAKSPSFIEFTHRYFTHFLQCDVKRISRHNVRLLVHSNKEVVLLTLDPTNFLFDTYDFNDSGKKVFRYHLKSISFESNKTKKEKNSKSSNDIACVHPTGKRKKNAIRLEKFTQLCSIEYCDTQKPDSVETLSVPAMIDGSVLEVNRRLLDDPSLLQCSPQSDGFLAIIRPRLLTQLQCPTLKQNDKPTDLFNSEAKEENVGVKRSREVPSTRRDPNAHPLQYFTLVWEPPRIKEEED